MRKRSGETTICFVALVLSLVNLLFTFVAVTVAMNFGAVQKTEHDRTYKSLTEAISRLTEELKHGR